MLKYLVLLIPLLTLQGCMYQTVDTLDILTAEKACAEHGGVKYVVSVFSGEVSASCFDGTKINVGKFSGLRDSILSEKLKGG